MRVWHTSVIFFTMLGVMLCGIGKVQADDADILEQYAPVYQFSGQESCFPVDVDYFVDTSVLYEYTDSGKITIENNPTLASLGNASSGTDLYLDSTKGTLLDAGVISDYQSKLTSLGYTVYGRVVEYTIDGIDVTIAQYWTFYVFNKGSLNIHEGDWEMVQVIIIDDEPSEVMFSQHHAGQKATWDQVDKNGDHVIVYVAEGTHANYIRSYSGRFGVANDIVGASGRRLNVNEYTIEVLSSQGWLDFSGHWGYYGGPEDELRGKTGPNGPKFRENGEIWNNALVWGQELAPADNNIFIIEWLLSNFLLIFILLTALTLAILFLRVYNRHLTYGLGPRMLSILYIDGINRKSIGNILCIIGLIIAAGAMITPWYILSADINVPGQETGGFVDLISIDGLSGIEINLLDPAIGITPLSALILPFSLIIGIGLVLLIISTLGISSSKKLGRKYAMKGVRLMVPIILILVAFMIMGGIVDVSELAPTESSAFENILGDVGASPWNGAGSYSIPEYQDAPASVSVQWGLGTGGVLLLLAGVLLLIAGMLENAAKIDFFKEKTIDDTFSKIAAQKEKKEDSLEDFIEKDED